MWRRVSALDAILLKYKQLLSTAESRQYTFLGAATILGQTGKRESIFMKNKENDSGQAGMTNMGAVFDKAIMIRLDVK